MEHIHRSAEFGVTPCMWEAYTVGAVYLLRVMLIELSGRSDGEPGRGKDQVSEDIQFVYNVAIEIASIIRDATKRK